MRTDVLGRFVALLRERFDGLRKANLFLARQHGALAALRLNPAQLDTIGRVIVVLLRPERTDLGQWRQLTRAEAELRRATTEPYAIAVMLEERKLQGLRDEYAAVVLPLASDVRLSTAPSLDVVDAVLEEARSVHTLGGECGRGDWDAAIVELMMLFERARDLHQSMSAHLATARQIRQERVNRWFAWVGIVLALLGMGLSLALGA